MKSVAPGHGVKGLAERVADAAADDLGRRTGSDEGVGGWDGVVLVGVGREVVGADIDAEDLAHEDGVVLGGG